MSRDGHIELPGSRAYRRRRLTDAARFLPVLGLFLFILPALAAGSGEAETTADGLVFVFSVWGLLIVASASLSRWLGGEDGEEEGNPRG